MPDRQYHEDFDWDQHARNSVPFVLFLVLLTAAMYLVAVL
jgi:hypothetical protein